MFLADRGYFHRRNGERAIARFFFFFNLSIHHESTSLTWNKWKRNRLEWGLSFFEEWNHHSMIVRRDNRQSLNSTTCYVFNKQHSRYNEKSIRSISSKMPIPYSGEVDFCCLNANCQSHGLFISNVSAFSSETDQDEELAITDHKKTPCSTTKAVLPFFFFFVLVHQLWQPTLREIFGELSLRNRITRLIFKSMKSWYWCIRNQSPFWVRYGLIAPNIALSNHNIFLSSEMDRRRMESPAVYKYYLFFPSPFSFLSFLFTSPFASPKIRIESVCVIVVSDRTFSETTHWNPSLTSGVKETTWESKTLLKVENRGFWDALRALFG